MNKENKIFIITECPYSGILRALLEDAAILSKLGYPLNFIVPKTARDRYGETLKSNVARMKKLGKVYYLPLRRKYRYIPRDKKNLKSFLKKEKKYIVLSYTGYAGKICRMLYKDGVIKNLYHVPQCIDIIRRKFFTKIIEYFFEKGLAKHSAHYLACSSSEVYALHNTYCVEPEKILLNPGSIPQKRFNERKKYKYIFVGRIVKDKGIYSILETLDLLGLLDELIVIGDGCELNNLKSKYPEVRFLRAMSNEKVLKYLQASEFIISDSIIEGLPFSIIEAMSFGVVPILSSVDGHTDLVLNNHNGFLFQGKKELTNIIFQTKIISEDKLKRMSLEAVKTTKKLRQLKKKLLLKYFKAYE